MLSNVVAHWNIAAQFCCWKDNSFGSSIWILGHSITLSFMRGYITFVIPLHLSLWFNIFNFIISWCALNMFLSSQLLPLIFFPLIWSSIGASSNCSWISLLFYFIIYSNLRHSHHINCRCDLYLKLTYNVSSFLNNNFAYSLTWNLC